MIKKDYIIPISILFIIIFQIIFFNPFKLISNDIFNATYYIKCNNGSIEKVNNINSKDILIICGKVYIGGIDRKNNGYNFKINLSSMFYNLSNP